MITSRMRLQPPGHFQLFGGEIWRSGSKLLCPRFYIPKISLLYFSTKVACKLFECFTKRYQCPSCLRVCFLMLLLPEKPFKIISNHCQSLALNLTMVEMPSLAPSVRSMYSPATIMMKLSRKPKPMKGREL